MKGVFDKIETILKMLDRGGITGVRFDARHPEVKVPPALKTDPALLLNFSFNFDGRDLVVSPWGLKSTLSFKGKDFYCEVPWQAIFVAAKVDDPKLPMEQYVWSDDIPASIKAGWEEKKEEEKETPKVFPKLRLVK